MSDSFYKAISDRTRREILSLLRRKGPMSVNEIAGNFTISLPAISEHLKVLRNADLVSTRKEKQFVFYSLNTTVLEDLGRWILDLIQKKEVNDD
ncbi:MAG TPA: winged helix-turn-helix transcriptional regulator [Candidatus Cloacimonetes bacterium]|jgi:DNA-binding transcriptional ArsR family regulator|nr:transcriptional regulator [Candidatus Cloacimonas sp.]HHZ14984.1 winged helix-turn-helix transcriptional regulator [Candidatus Cloacimonadota bacterium]